MEGTSRNCHAVPSICFMQITQHASSHIISSLQYKVSIYPIFHISGHRSKTYASAYLPRWTGSFIMSSMPVSIMTNAAYTWHLPHTTRYTLTMEQHRLNLIVPLLNAQWNHSLRRLSQKHWVIWDRHCVNISNNFQIQGIACSLPRLWGHLWHPPSDRNTEHSFCSTCTHSSRLYLSQAGHPQCTWVSALLHWRQSSTHWAFRSSWGGNTTGHQCLSIWQMLRNDEKATDSHYFSLSCFHIFHTCVLHKFPCCIEPICFG